MYTYSATVVKVIDGDTVDLNIDLGFKIVIKLRCRLTGINAPEGKQTDAAIWLREQLPIGTNILIETKKTQEKYGRWLATLFLNGLNLNLELINKGMAEAYSTH
jgi:micrococcal nuclease